MSNKSFKAQASSSRATLGGGFGERVPGATYIWDSARPHVPLAGSILSYLVPPPDIQWISDPNVVVSFKSLSKKDATTKTKALEDLRAFVKSPPPFQENIESTIIRAWAKHYPKLAIDNSRRVRELAHQTQYDVTTAVKKRMEKHMPEVIPTWLVGILDRDRAVAKIALDGLTSSLKTDDRVQMCWRLYQSEILDYARISLNETPETLCDDRSTSADEIQETYLRVMGSSVSLVEFLLSKLNKADILKHQDKYKLYFEENAKKLWGLISCADGFVRKSVAQLLIICLKKQHGLVELNLELISKAFIAGALSSSQSASALQLIQALEPLTKEYPEVWGSLYKAKKPATSKLLSFIAKGSQGGPAAYWQSLNGLLAELPDVVLFSDIDTSSELLAAYLDGINNREEHRSNAEQAWTSYLQIADFLGTRLPGETAQLKLFEDAVFPIFEQYIHPTVQKSKWSLGSNTSILAKAFDTCASTADTALRRAFGLEWQRLADDFISRIRTSLPEQSKDYKVSQASIAAEGQRWFILAKDICRLSRNPDIVNILEQHSSKVISAALDVTSSRNGKAYSAASIVDAAVRLTPQLFRQKASNRDTLRAFIEQHFNRLLVSPSMTYLVSILLQNHTFGEQKYEYAKFWQSAVYSALQLPEEVTEQKVQIIVALTASHTVQEIAVHNQELQGYLYKMCVKALHGDPQGWLIFETAITFHTIGPAQAALVLHAVIAGVDRINKYAKNALQALDLIAKKNPVLLEDHNLQMLLLTKLLAVSEIDNNDPLSSKALTLRLLLAPHPGTGESEAARGRIVELVHSELESASLQSLHVGTLFTEALEAMKHGRSPEAIALFLPKLAPWGEALGPFLRRQPSLALGVLPPYAGAVFLINDRRQTSSSAVSRDANGYAVPLRMTIFVTRLLGLHELTSLVPRDLQTQYLYYLALTHELVNDQLDLREESMLFEPNTKSDFKTELQRMLKDIQLILGCITRNTRSWRDEDSSLPDHDNSWLVQSLVNKFLEASTSRDPQGYYAGKALSRFMGTLVCKAWKATGGDEWLEHLGIMRTTTQNIFGASAILIAGRSSFSPHKSVNNLCNRLISDIVVASPNTETLEKLVLLNACFMVYDGNSAEIPVAQTRLISAVKQILSWSQALATTHIELASEACRALHRLLPAIKDVYGSYWLDALDLSAAIWSSADLGILSDERIPAVGMSLELVSILQNLTDANEDLTDALDYSKGTISDALLDLLELRRSTNNLPLQLVDQLLLRKSIQINTPAVTDLPHLYPLLASDFPLVQSASFHVLQKALINAQEQVSLNVALDGTSATIDDELLSLLLDAPDISNFDDNELESFPSSVRRYLLSWRLVLDCFSAASNTVRGDYSTQLDTGDYIGPFLKFMFDVLGHSAASPLKLDKEGIDNSMIRNCNTEAVTSPQSSGHEMYWLMVNLYYLSLKYVPGLVKKWYKACDNRQTSKAVGAWTAKWFSALVAEDILDEVAQWSEKQEAKAGDEKTLRIKISKNSREVFAGYEIDDMEMVIVIRLPPEYPLNIVDVQSINRVAIPEKKWNNFLAHTQGAIQFTNGSIVDGLETFQKNVVGSLKGHSQCAICYSTVSEQKKLPDRECATCHQFFHNDCLHTWFNSASTNTCPLCRNPFQYATANRSRG